MAKILKLGSGADMEKMRDIKHEVERTVLKYKDTVEAAIVAGALIQIARTLYLLYPPAVREDLLIVADAFLTGKEVEVESESGIVITDKGLLN